MPWIVNNATNQVQIRDKEETQDGDQAAHGQHVWKNTCLRGSVMSMRFVQRLKVAMLRRPSASICPFTRACARGTPSAVIMPCHHFCSIFLFRELQQPAWVSTYSIAYHVASNLYLSKCTYPLQSCHMRFLVFLPCDLHTRALQDSSNCISRWD